MQRPRSASIVFVSGMAAAGRELDQSRRKRDLMLFMLEVSLISATPAATKLVNERENPESTPGLWSDEMAPKAQPLWHQAVCCCLAPSAPRAAGARLRHCGAAAVGCRFSTQPIASSGVKGGQTPAGRGIQSVSGLGAMRSVAIYLTLLQILQSRSGCVYALDSGGYWGNEGLRRQRDEVDGPHLDSSLILKLVELS